MLFFRGNSCILLSKPLWGTSSLASRFAVDARVEPWCLGAAPSTPEMRWKWGQRCEKTGNAWLDHPTTVQAHLLAWPLLPWWCSLMETKVLELGGTGAGFTGANRKSDPRSTSPNDQLGPGSLYIFEQIGMFIALPQTSLLKGKTCQALSNNVKATA